MNTQGMKCIGKGAFSTVYQKTPKKVLIKSTDNVKECMSFGWFPASSMFPKVKRIDVGNEYSFYEMKYYPKVRSLKNNLKPFEYEFYKVLRSLTPVWNINPYDRYYELHWLFDTIPNKFHHRRQVLKDTLESLSNYGTDIGFEISPRNVAVDRGKLILLDCFYFISALTDRRK